MSEIKDGPHREPISFIERAQLAASANSAFKELASQFSTTGEPSAPPITIAPDDILDREHLRAGDDEPDFDVVYIGRESADGTQRYTFPLLVPRTPIT